MEMYTKDSGRRIRPTVKGSIYIWMVLSITELGLMINKRGKELKHGLMGPSTRACIWAARNMDKESLNGQTALNSRASSPTTTSKDKACTRGLMVVSTPDSGTSTRCTELVIGRRQLQS